MRARLLDSAAPEWSAFLATNEHDFYHLPGYVELAARTEGGRAAALWVEDADARLLLPLVIRDIPGGGVDATSPYGYPGPISNTGGDGAFVAAAVAAGVAALAEAGIVSAFVRLHPILDPEPPGGPGVVVDHGPTVAIDVSRPAEDRWGEVRERYRTQIRSARRDGLEVRFDDQLERLADFARLYRATMERLTASAFYFFDDAYFEALRTALGPRLHLGVAEVDGALVGGALFVETCGIVEYHLSATDAAFARLGPTKVLIPYAADWAHERGNRVLHLGGGVGASEDSLFHFKAGFSPGRARFRTLRLVPRPAAYARLVAARDAALDARDLTGFFPAYRLP